MILDEATSSIDTRTERHIEQGMDALMEGRTVFVIAHRLSTVRNSNCMRERERQNNQYNTQPPPPGGGEEGGPIPKPKPGEEGEPKKQHHLRGEPPFS